MPPSPGRSPDPESTPGFVFISYSHDDDDAAYVARLADVLVAAGVPVWYDRDIPGGDRWERMLRDRLDTCAAFVVVMTPAAAVSEWVAREVRRARQTNRPVLPLLRSGTVFAGLTDLQYQDVRSGGLPPPGWVARLRDFISAPRAVGPARLVGRGFPRRNRDFVGRHDLLDEMARVLLWGQPVAVHALHGMGGVGKTQLAAEYAHRHRDHYQLIAWIDAEQPDLIIDQIAALAAHLGVPVGPDAAGTAAAVVDALDTSPVRWLVIFDNATRPDHLDGFIPRSGTGDVIITSRYPSWTNLGPGLDVDVFPRTDAIGLLRRRAPQIQDDEQAGRICALLGDLPLAIDQAGAYLNQTGMSATEYHALLSSRGDELLDQGHPVGHQHSIATLWTLSQHQLEAVNPAAATLLRLCAFLSPEPIPLDLFTHHPDLLPDPLRIAGDPIAFNAVVAALLDYSLIRRTSDSTMIILHRLQAAAIRRPLPTRDHAAALTTLRQLLARDLPQEAEMSPGAWPRWRILLPHVLAVTHASTPADADASYLLDLAGRYLRGQGQLATAIALFEQALQIDVTLYEPDHPYTLIARSNLAATYRVAGRLNEAIALYEQVLSERRRRSGSDHPESLNTGNNLAITYQVAGRLNEAIALYEQVLVDKLRVLGEDDPSTLRTRHNLAAAHHDAGRVDEAIARYEQLLVDRQRILGDDHLDTLSTRNNLAIVYKEAGRVDEAIALYHQTIADYRRIVGDDHPDTLSTRHNLAILYHALGRVEEAIDLFAQVLDDQRRLLGDDHPDTVRSRNSLASARRARAAPGG